MTEIVDAIGFGLLYVALVILLAVVIHHKWPPWWVLILAETFGIFMWLSGPPAH